MRQRKCITDRAVIYTEDGHISGKINGTTYTRHIRTNHILAKPPALAMDVTICKQLAARGVERLVFKNMDTGEIYRATFPHFMRVSFELDRGRGRQRALPLAGWTRERPGGPCPGGPKDRPAQPQSEPTNIQDGPVQFGLWGGR